MKLITLNIWGGIVFEPLIKFVEMHASDTDIFCFQEVLFGSRPEFTPIHKSRENIFDELARRLSGFTSYKSLSQDIEYFSDEPLDEVRYGQAIFIKRPLLAKNHNSVSTYPGDIAHDDAYRNEEVGNCQGIEVEKNDAIFTVVNLHGVWQKNTEKLDTPERLRQSEIVRDFLRGRSGKKILCGDFNLAPNTKSIAMLEERMRNLIKEHKIETTRSRFYKKDNSKFADYILISPDIRVMDFRVMQDIISDHLPLFIEFE